MTVTEFSYFVLAGGTAPANHGHSADWVSQLSQLDHPVVRVTWDDATAYAKWIAVLIGQLWRLPTEAEWEKVARRRGATGPCCLVAQDGKKRPPPGIGDTFFGQVMVLDHVGRLQVFVLGCCQANRTPFYRSSTIFPGSGLANRLSIAATADCCMWGKTCA